MTGPFSLNPRGWTYRTIVRLLFDPAVTLPPLAIIYHADIKEAEEAGASEIKMVFASVARDRTRMGAPHAGYHERTIRIPLAIARELAFEDYQSYLDHRAARLALAEIDADHLGD